VLGVNAGLCSRNSALLSFDYSTPSRVEMNGEAALDFWCAWSEEKEFIMKKRQSPFYALLNYIEGELFDLVLDQQLPREERTFSNPDFVIGYRAALNLMLEKALCIHARAYNGEMLLLNPTTEEASAKLLELLEKRGC
jgi:hypothetical protein